MILSKAREARLAQVGVEVAEALDKEVRIAVLERGKIRKDKEPLRTVRHMRPQANVVSSSAELNEMLVELQCNRVCKLGVRLEMPAIRRVWSAEQSDAGDEDARPRRRPVRSTARLCASSRLSLFRVLSVSVEVSVPARKSW